MSNIVNLRKARKAKARVAAALEAAENRVRFGRSKAQRAAQEGEAERAAKRIEEHRRETPDDT